MERWRGQGLARSHNQGSASPRSGQPRRGLRVNGRCPRPEEFSRGSQKNGQARGPALKGSWCLRLEAYLVLPGAGALTG
jgi:hypothetical protein